MNLKVEKSGVGVRLDRFIADNLDEVSRSQVKKLIVDGQILLNGEVAKVSTLLSRGDVVDVDMSSKTFAPISAEDIPLDIVFENNDFLVVNKPAGMVVHPAENAHFEGTVANAVMQKIEPGVGEEGRPGIVHRLDKDTSGLLLVARTQRAYEMLVSLFKRRRIAKKYLSLVVGRLEHPEGVIDSPIGRNTFDRKKMGIVAVKKGKNAVTKYRVLREFEYENGRWLSLLEVRIETGRTHQIRVHMAAIGHPVVGDKVYGNASFNRKFEENYSLRRQFLHASSLKFEYKKEAMDFEAPLPEDLSEVLKAIS